LLRGAERGTFIGMAFQTCQKGHYGE
jgi:hypothetical protein